MRILIDEKRLGFVARKDATVADDDVFIGDDAIQINIFAGDGVLHYNAVFDMGVLADLYAAEEYRIFDRALDNAAVRDKRIADDRTGNVGCRCGIANLCEYGAVLYREYRSADIGIEKIHTATVIIGKRANGCEIAVELKGADVMEFAITDEDILCKARISSCNGIGDKLLEIFSADHHNTDANVLKAVLESLIFADLGDSAVFVRADYRQGTRAVLRNITALDTERYIGVGGDMLIDHRRKVDIANGIAVGQYHYLLLTVGNEVADAYERFKTGAVEAVA